MGHGLILFYLNGCKDDHEYIQTDDDVLSSITDYLQNTLVWHGNCREFREWSKPIDNDYTLFWVHNGTVNFSSHVHVDQVVAFIELWNEYFGDSQHVSYCLG